MCVCVCVCVGGGGGGRDSILVPSSNARPKMRVERHAILDEAIPAFRVLLG